MSTTTSSAGSKSNSAKDTSVANTIVKTEKRARESDTGEYDEWAKRLVSRPIPQLQPTTGNNFSAAQIFQSGSNTFLIQGIPGGPSSATCVGGDGLPPHNGFDMDSAVGRFTWVTLAEDKYVPCIYRSGDVFCCVRMAETVLVTFLRSLPQEIANAVILVSHTLTNAEAKLLTYINNWHCDGFYGADPFTAQDLIVSLPELEKYFFYLSFSYQVLQSGGGNRENDFSKCGFVRVNQDSLIPYTVMNDNDKGVPLFYFEGQIDILNAKSQLLSGWELAYLKLCCKVQGVRKDLISGETLRIVKLVDLKGYFPKRTTFVEKNWPPARPKSLLPKQTQTGFQLTATTSRWTTQTLPNSTFNKSLSNSGSLTTRSLSALTFTSPQFTSTNGYLNPTSSSNNVITQQGLNGVSRNGLNLGVTTAATSSNSGTSNSTQASIIMPNGSQIQVPKTQITAARTMNFSKIRAPGPPADTTKLNIIPEYQEQGHSATSTNQSAYSVRMIIIDKEVMHCINQKPHKSDVYLLVLQEFLMRFFPTPQTSIYPTCVSVLKSIGITTYLPNRSCFGFAKGSGQSDTKKSNHTNVLRFTIFHLVWELPLIAATDAASQLSKLKTLLTPKPTSGLRNTVARPISANNRTLVTTSGSNRPVTRNSGGSIW